MWPMWPKGQDGTDRKSIQYTAADIKLHQKEITTDYRIPHFAFSFKYNKVEIPYNGPSAIMIN